MALSKTLYNLDDWLNYIEGLHSAEIEFGLQRVDTVFGRLFSDGFSCRVVTVGGTNGKGSTCALIERILLNAGYSCGKHTSPHLSKFNERIVLNGMDVDDVQIIHAFAQVEKCRQETQLTYFEFTFLAALIIFHEQSVDFAVCEVGMGGRLDAVNILSPEVSVITNIGLDHMQWLGETRAEIACEKVAISRAKKPCVIGDNDFPYQAQQYLRDNNVVTLLLEKEFSMEIDAKSWQINVQSEVHKRLSFDKSCLESLPVLVTKHQYQNAACAILAILSLQDIKVTHKHIESALIHNHLPGRCQIISEKPYIVIDVAHNPDSVVALREFIKSSGVTAGESSETKIIAVFSMLDDKDIANTLNEISREIDEWHVAELNVARAASADKIVAAIHTSQKCAKVFQYDRLSDAFDKAKKSLKPVDCLLVFGSFFAVSDILRHYQK